MTVRYQSKISSGFLRGFAPLLFRWKGSVYKLVYRELLAFILAYVVIMVIYRFGLNAEQRSFELLSLYCSAYIDWIPLSFVLGFYISMVVQRWWTICVNVPSPDRLLNTVVTYVEGDDEKGHLIRRNLMRYWNLLLLLVMQSISSAVKKRFPTLQHVVKAGYMTEEELDIFKSIDIPVAKFWIPSIWFLDLLKKAKAEGRVKSEVAVKHIVEELNETRSKLGLLWCHDWIALPLVYTQVVTWAVYLFFIISLIGRQYLDPAKKYKGHELDLYLPVFTIIQFVFYMGWLKVAESLFNAFGNDDDDIEMNWLLDRHLMVSYVWIDQVHPRCPTSLLPYRKSDKSDSPEGKSTEEGQEEQRTSGKKWTSLFGKAGGETEPPRMLGRRDPLMTRDALARLNRGTWKFSAEQARRVQRRSDGWSAMDHIASP